LSIAGPGSAGIVSAGDPEHSGFLPGRRVDKTAASRKEFVMSLMIDPDSLPPPRSRDGLATTVVWLIAAVVLFVVTVAFLQLRI
jgi:hypothetical protein